MSISQQVKYQQAGCDKKEKNNSNKKMKKKETRSISRNGALLMTKTQPSLGLSPQNGRKPV